MELLEALRNPAALVPFFYYFDDFIRQDSVVDLGAFDFTAVATGTAATQAANGGTLRISGAATTDASGGQIQAEAAHVCTAGKFISFLSRQQISESTSTNGATESQLYAGLFPVDTTIDASLPADGIYFVKADGGTTIQCVLRVGSANTYAGSVAAATYTEDKAMHYFGIGVVPNGTHSTVVWTIDGVIVAHVEEVSLPASSVILTPSLAFRSGDATGTKFCDVDYIGSYQAR